jgi:hypothetical protein
LHWFFWPSCVAQANAGTSEGAVAIIPIPPNGHDPETEGADSTALDEETLRTLRGFFELLDEWDRQDSTPTPIDIRWQESTIPQTKKERGG